MCAASSFDEDRHIAGSFTAPQPILTAFSALGAYRATAAACQLDFGGGGTFNARESADPDCCGIVGEVNPQRAGHLEVSGECTVQGLNRLREQRHFRGAGSDVERVGCRRFTGLPPGPRGGTES